MKLGKPGSVRSDAFKDGVAARAPSVRPLAPDAAASATVASGSLKSFSSIELRRLLCKIDHRGSVLLDAVWLFLAPKTIRVRVEEISTKWKVSGGLMSERRVRGQSKRPSISP